MIGEVSTLLSVELGVLGPLRVRQDGAPVAIPGAKPRAILTMLGLHGGSAVPADTLVELLWGEDPPRTAAKALQTHISSLRRSLGDGVVLTQGAGWILAESEVDASRYKSAVRLGRAAAAAGDTSQAVARFEEALALWRGIPELPDGRRGTSEKTRWIEGHSALVEDRADALLATGRAAEVVGDLEAAVADAPLRERRWGQLMLALYRAGRQGEALGAFQRARALLADELGVDPGTELRRLEGAIVAQDASLDIAVAQHLASVTRAVTFLLTDIEGSTAAWEANAAAMALALARHDQLVEQVVTSRGGRLIKTRGEGDATFSVFERPSAAASAAIELQDAVFHEPWVLRDPLRIRIALHTGEVELRDGDYFGRAVNRVARLRSLAEGGQILCSGATAELVIDSLSDDVVLADLGMRQLKNLARPEHVFELRLETADDHRQDVPPQEPIKRPSLPAVLAGPGPFVGRGRELARLFSAWQTTLAGGTNAVLIAGEPGVGKTRLAGEWSRQAYDQGALVIYGRCDEDLGAPYQPFAEALRSLVPCVGAKRLRGLRGVEALLAMVPGLTDVLPDLAARTRADPDTERFALFDAVVALLGVASAGTPVVLILDDLQWAAKPTLLLLRHLLRFGEQARVEIVGTYRSTDLDRSHPLAATLADLHRDGTAERIQLSGLDEDDVTAYVAEAGYDDEELARALASVTGGNPFFLIEALRHVEESGGHWDPSTLPQGVREAVTRRLSRLTPETNKALGAAAVVGSRFGLELVERVVGDDLVDAFDEACKAGIVIEEPGGNYRFNHALVRQSLLAELASVRRMRLHQRIATTLETQPGADDELLAELAYHYFECAWAGNAAKAVDYCTRAADQAMARLGYEAAADLYDRALHALEEIDDELPDRDDQAAGLLVARCEALLAAGDVATAAGAVSQLQRATTGSARLAAWATCFDGELSMLIHPERLDEIEAALGAAAAKLAEFDDAAGEAKAHTVRATCLARLGRVGDCEIALDDALTAARRAGEHRRVNAVLAGAPLAALWGPNPVPRAGGRCLDVVRLLRITTDSPAVEATSTRCQAVLEAFRGRTAAARRMIESARRTVTELGLRHALLEVEQFAGIVELVVDDPAAAESHLRKAYNGFRCLGLDADTAETAALLGRACLALDQEAEADELCTESERLAGHALKPAIAWRMLRAQFLSRRGDHDEARRVAEAAVGLAERTDALVDHGEACLALATVLGTAGDVAGSRAAAERAVDLYERKGAAALAEKARRIVDEPGIPSVRAPLEVPPAIELDTACVRAGKRVAAAINRGDWEEFEGLFAPEASVESRRKIVGFAPIDISFDDWQRQNRRILEAGEVRLDYVFIAVRGERLALSRCYVGTADASPGAPTDELLQVYGIDEEGRVALQIWFDAEDIDAALAELDAANARLKEMQPKARRLENAAIRVLERYFARFAAHDWDVMAATLTGDFVTDDRRRVVNAGLRRGRDAEIANMQSFAEIGILNMASTAIAIRGDRLVLGRHVVSFRDWAKPSTDVIGVVEINTDNQISAHVMFDADDIDAAIAEIDARYLAGEAAAHAHTWSVVAAAYAGFNRRELLPTTPDWANIDHRRGAAFGPGDMIAYIQAAWGDSPDTKIYIGAVHRLSNIGAVVTHQAHGISQEGFDAEWRDVHVLALEGDKFSRSELFDEGDLDAAIARFDQLSRPASQLENAASRANARLIAYVNAREWDAAASLLADDHYSDDRRRVTGAGIRRGPDADIENFRVVADLGANITLEVIATRGDRLVLTRSRVELGEEQQPFTAEFLGVVEADLNGRFAAVIELDLEDLDAAIAELDARYLAGEAAAFAHTWSVMRRSVAAFNRRELPTTTPGWVNIDHRRGASFAPGEMFSLLNAAWKHTSDFDNFIEAVHRLNDFGGVVTHAARETSKGGFHAEWRVISLMTLAGDMVNRCEVFDESDLDAALARFDDLNTGSQRLENAASRVWDRFQAFLKAEDWAEIATMAAGDLVTDDRRRVVGAGVHRGRTVNIAILRASADIGIENVKSTVIATRGERLLLDHVHYSGRDQTPKPFQTEMIRVLEIDPDERICAAVFFDPDDGDAAFEELDARYLTGEAAADSSTWSAVSKLYAAFNRRDLPAVDWVTVDHRQGTPFASSDLTTIIRVAQDLTPDLRINIESVHRLSRFGAVITNSSYGTSQEGLGAEWKMIQVLVVEGDRINRLEIFDKADLDAALVRFDELQSQSRRLANAAIRVTERFFAHFAAGDWDTVRETLADNFHQDDRRRLVGAGVRHGRDEEIADLRAIADLWTGNAAPTFIATRGERLALMRLRFSLPDQGNEAFLTEILGICEINAEERIVAAVSFDSDDLDAAFEELDARYLAGEAAAYSQTWTAMTQIQAVYNQHEFPSTTKDIVTTDHRRGRAFTPDEVIPFLGATYDVVPNVKGHIEAVHRLSNFGVVVTEVMTGTSQEGFDAEWREIGLFAFDGALVCRFELFDETDLDASLARFEELHPKAQRLDNAASRVWQRFQACSAAKDWAAMAEILVDDSFLDDRRQVVNGGLWDGRDVVIENLRATADFKVENLMLVATRGSRLVLSRFRWSNSGEGAEMFHTDALCLVEVDAHDRMAATVVFDRDDIDAAFAELDARYLASEAAAHAHTWSVIADGYAALNRHAMPPTTPDCVNVDHRRETAFGPDDLAAYQNAGLELDKGIKVFVAEVHRLDELGAVVSYAAHETSQQGFDAEWRGVAVFTIDGDLINRIEAFQEEDLDAALARFDELQPQLRRLENAASQVAERYLAHFAAGDWNAVAEMMADNYLSDDRRPVVGAGIRRGRDAQMSDMRAIAEVWLTDVSLTVIATRGERLILTRSVYSGHDQRSEAFHTEVLAVGEIDADERIAASVSFDPADIDSAIAELDARFLAGEGAAHAHTWSAIAQGNSAANRHETLPTTPDCLTIDHRLQATLNADGLTDYLRASWDLTPNLRMLIESVHRLSDLGAVVTHASHGTSPDDFDAEWRQITLFTVEANLCNRLEIFDEADLDAALARFDELRPQAPRLKNAASATHARLTACVAAHDWNALSEILADDIAIDDRRRVVNSGITYGRDAAIANMGGVIDVGLTNISSTVTATRGDRLDLCRTCVSGQDRPDAFQVEFFSVVEIDADERIVARVLFDLEDIDAAFEELDARYLAGEAADHAHTWSVIARGCAAFNRHELAATTPDPVHVDHRPLVSIPVGVALAASQRAVWDLTPDVRTVIEAVNRLSELGAVVTQVVKGTSPEGFDAEWQMISVLTVDGDLISHFEVFDEADLDAALARFDELTTQDQPK